MNIFQSYLNLNKPAVSFEVNQVRVSSFKKKEIFKYLKYLKYLKREFRQVLKNYFTNCIYILIKSYTKKLSTLYVHL